MGEDLIQSLTKSYDRRFANFSNINLKAKDPQPVETTNTSLAQMKKISTKNATVGVQSDESLQRTNVQMQTSDFS